MATLKTERIQTYAQRLVQTAQARRELPALLSDVQALLPLFESQQLENFFDSHSVTEAEKNQVLLTIQAKTSGVLAHFFEEVMDQGQYAMLLPVFSEVIRYSQQVMDQYDLTVTSVVPLTEAQLQRLTAIVSHRLHLQVRQIHQRLDESLLGGFVLEVNHQVIDASVRHQLQQVKRNLK